MASISLIPLIEIFEKNRYENIENNDLYVVLWKKEWENFIDKIMIPKYEEDKDEYVSIVNRKMDRLINSSADNDLIEELNFQKNILKLSAVTDNDKLSFRIMHSDRVKIDKFKKIITKFSTLAQRYGELIWDREFSEELDFLQTTKWSFVINVSLPPHQETLIDDVNKNQTFVDILSDTSKNDFDTILWNYQWYEWIKSFIWWLKDFSEEVLCDAEMFYTTKKSLNKVINIISTEQKKDISESLKEIEETIQHPYQLDEKEFTIISTTNPIWNRITKVQLSTTLDSISEVVFLWSWVSVEDFTYIKQRNSRDESIFLRNVRFIKLRDYYRIISAEVIKDW